MGYSSLRQCIVDLEKNGYLVRISSEVDPELEMALIQRRVYEARGPAILYERVRGCRFQAVSNIFGTLDRCRFIFRDTLEDIKKIVKIRGDRSFIFKNPLSSLSLPLTLMKSLPLKVRKGPVTESQCLLSDLPQIKSWPGDGGAFITLPQVFSESPAKPGIFTSNLGMYRIQISGNKYLPDREAGLHYQIHRGIGVHHAQAIEQGRPLKVSVFTGGPPAHTFAAVMPLPEGMSELLFAGMLGSRMFRYIRHGDNIISADADFCITGEVETSSTLPEGPFGDHLGYYSLVHDFPVLKVKKIFCRKDAIWPFTSVGRPPQEDTSFGKLIHEISAPAAPAEVPGLKALHAVDEAGVHPLLLAVGSERYVPWQERRPMELLTIANALLGFGQCSLAKYLFIAAGEDNPYLDINNVQSFFTHILKRVDWKTDIHFQTSTTMDTLDYSGTGLNMGSKVIVAAAGPERRILLSELPAGTDLHLPEGFRRGGFIMPGVMVVRGDTFTNQREPGTGENLEMKELEKHLPLNMVKNIPLIVVVDDPAFCLESLKNFLWVTFTRSNPSDDIHGAGSFIVNKHWGCHGPLIIDARIKPHHAPPLIDDPETIRKVDALGAKGGPLYGII